MPSPLTPEVSSSTADALAGPWPRGPFAVERPVSCKPRPASLKTSMNQETFYGEGGRNWTFENPANLKKVRFFKLQNAQKKENRRNSVQNRLRGFCLKYMKTLQIHCSTENLSSDTSSWNGL